MIKIKYLLFLLVLLGASACSSDKSEEDEQVGQLPNYDSLRVALLDSSVLRNNNNNNDNSDSDNTLKHNKISERKNNLVKDSVLHKKNISKSKIEEKEEFYKNLKVVEKSVNIQEKEKEVVLSDNALDNSFTTNKKKQKEPKDRIDQILHKGLTLDKLREMGFLYVKLNSENLKSVRDMYDSGYVDTLSYEKIKLSIEKNLRIIRLLNQLSWEQGLQDEKFIVIYLDQFIEIVREGLITSQEVLEYLQRVYDTNKVSQHKYIVSANNLRVNVDLMWRIIREIDFK